MFRAIGRYIKAFFYLLSGKVDNARRALSENPNVIQANYDEIISDKRNRLNVYKKAVSGLISQEESKKEKLREATTKIVDLEKMKSGAAERAKQLINKHKGDKDIIKGDPEYVKCQAAFRDFSSTLEEKQKYIDELEGDVSNLTNSIANHKTQISSLLREIEKLQEEKHVTVAEIVSAKEEKEIADMISGISEDKSGKELQELREVRRLAKANARVSREIAGLDAKQSDNEFLQYASAKVVDNEFEKLIGLAPNAENPQLLDVVIETTNQNRENAN